jgi:ATP-dependent RNA helicase RhlE
MTNAEDTNAQPGRSGGAPGQAPDTAPAEQAAEDGAAHASGTEGPAKRRRRGGRRRHKTPAVAAAVIVDPLLEGVVVTEPEPSEHVAAGEAAIPAAQTGAQRHSGGGRHGGRERRHAPEHPGARREHGRRERSGPASGHELYHDTGPVRGRQRHHRQPTDPAAFAPLGLSDTLLEAIGLMGFAEPTPIQEQSIPLLLEGRDVVGCSQTGSGKTLAFVAPILQRSAPGTHIKALAITPTRELARQIEEVALDMSETTGHSVAAVFGGVDYDRQKKKLKDGVDFLVATPGRLLDLQRRGDIDLSHVKYLVVDEADRLLDMGFWPDVRRIVHSLPKDRQNLLFSATMSRGVLDVISDTLRSPVHVEVGERATPVETVEQIVLPVNADQKTDLLAHYMATHDPTRTLVFTRTKVRADRVAHALERQDVKVMPIHSDLGQGQRMDALEGFRSGKIQVLVATDIVARGIDVQDVSHVVNYDVPERPEDYVHRIGRTARAGASGTAITLLSADEGYLLKDIERLIGMDIERRDIDGFEYNERKIPLSSELPRRPGKLLYDGGAKRAQKFGLRNVSKKRGRLIKR